MTEKQRTITVGINPELHPGKAPEDELQRLVWESMDTAWGFLSEQAVRVAIHILRQGFEAAGEEFLSDEELFTVDHPDAPRSYADLAVKDVLAAEMLEAGFDRLADVTLAQAAEEMGVTIRFEEG